MTQRTRSYPYVIHTQSSNIFVRLLRRIWRWM
jgi:hypothetical protein